MRHFHLLLSGIAQDWFWQYLRNNPRIDWLMLRDALLKRFRSHENDLQIIKQIMDKKQTSSENFEDYFISVLQLKSQLKTPMRDEDLIDILKTNIQTRLLNFIYPMNIISLEHFRNECKRVERILNAKYQVQNRQIRNVHEIEYEENGNCLYSEVDNSKYDTVSAVQRPQNNHLSNNTLKCFNCKRNGHLFINCPSPLDRLFCYRCGTDNFTV